jgi:HEPN superfamily AbiU2-like protein
MTSEEILQRNIDAMGEKFGKQYTALHYEFATLNLYWKEFLQLFAMNDKRIARLNEAAPGFFRMLQNQQFETNMMHLARITDKPQTGKFEHLTVARLPELAENETLKKQLTQLLATVNTKREFCKGWRDRQFAHSELAIAIKDGSAAPLPSATKKDFDEALAAVDAMLNAIEQHYFKSGTMYGEASTTNGAATLLWVLGFGVKAREQMRAKLAKGDVDDLGQPEHI